MGAWSIRVHLAELLKTIKPHSDEHKALEGILQRLREPWELNDFKEITEQLRTLQARTKSGHLAYLVRICDAHIRTSV